MAGIAALWTLCLAGIGGSLPLHAGERVAVLKVSGGEVRIERAGTLDAARGGQPLEAGDRLVTGSDGFAGITFDDNTRVSLGPGSDYRIERFAFDTTTHAGAFESRLQRGTLAMVSGKLAKQSPDAIKVKTPANVLGVRGTRFIVEVAP
jgi:hypothetical protein